MPVLVTCPSCGKQTSVSRKLAGKTVQCPACRGSMSIPNLAAPPPAPVVKQVAYVCTACGGSFPVEEVFDHQGQVICRSCYAKETARSAAVAGAIPSVSIVTCSGCGGSFHSSDVQQQMDGTVLCAACAAASEVATISYTPPPVSSVKRRKKKSGAVGFLLYAATIAIVITGIVIFARKYQDRLNASKETIPTVALANTTRPVLATQPSTRPAELSKNEKAYAPAIRDLLADATRSDQAGDLEGASRKYRDAFELAMKIPPTERSDALQKELAQAQVAWRAVTYQRQSSLNGDPTAMAQNPAMATTQPSESHADDSWEASHKKEVADLLDQAEASASGDKTAAFIKYTDLFKFVGQHLVEIKDPSLKQRLAKAADVRTQLASAMQIAATESTTPQPPTDPPVNSARAGNKTVAFAVDRLHLLTAAAPLGVASKVTMEDPQGNHLAAKVIATDRGLALLEINPKDVAKPGLNYMNMAEKFAAITLRCVALTDDNVFTPTPELLKSNSFTPPPSKEPWFVSFKQHPGLAGAPLINSGNEIVGMLTATAKDKPSHLPAIDISVIREFLSAHQALPTEPNPDSDPTAVYQASPAQ